MKNYIVLNGIKVYWLKGDRMNILSFCKNADCLCL